MSASTFNSTVAGAALPRHAAHHAAAPPPVASSSAPAGAFATGTKIQVGTHRVIIERYLSEGGFAHVYLVRLPRAVDGSDTAVLKRVAVPDKDALANMKTEVETMKKLKGHKYIVRYIDSHASQLRGGGYEVFLLMEFCQGGGLIDFMNTRLQNRLTEPEILHIFSDVSEGVACMHYLKPPLLHRDLKVENVLISSSGNTRNYKLCDFGSTAPPRPAATSVTECRLIEDDVQKHTTLQYRSPEMIDVYRKQPIDEKSDVWALGVLLYKLCYYTTPFEEQGQLAILNASFKFPGYPVFSDRLKKLIASMLREKPQGRPNIYQILREVCTMRGVEVPIKDIYTGRSQSEARKNQQLPSPEPTVKSPPIVGAVKAAPEQRKQAIPDVVPMRRGRPTSSSQPHSGIKPSPSPGRGVSNDPFAALDVKAGLNKDAGQDELSGRFPTLDQFSLLVDSGGKFDFEKPSRDSAPPANDLSRRVTEKLADEAFAQSSPTPAKKPIALEKSASVSAKPSIVKERQAELRPTSSHQPQLLHQPAPQRPAMVSQGTMTSPSPSPPEETTEAPKPRRSLHFPRPSLHSRSSSQPRSAFTDKSKLTPSYLHPQSSNGGLKRPILSESNRSRSQILTVPKSPVSSRPSLEGSRPNAYDDMDSSINRSKSANSRPRPSSVYVESSLRDRDASQRQVEDSAKARYDAGQLPSTVTGEQDETNISSNVEFLRAMEEEEALKRKEKRASSGSKHSKRTSLPSLSLSNPKSLFAGRFGDAFRRFETNASNDADDSPDPSEDRGQRELTPIAG
ncbi:MAG: mitochondrial glycerol-3-phosphate dehydrogenase, partial [Chaenotheca gracillima]